MEQLALIDCEAVGGGNWNLITEVFIALVTLNKHNKCEYEVTQTYHTLVNVPVKYHSQIKRSSVCKYVYQNLTGLSLSKLSEFGKPFPQVFKEVNALIDYWNVPTFARDPKLESTAFRRSDICEVLVLLQMPYSNLYYYKRSRPPVSSHRVCHFHFPVVLNKKPHCAQADVYNMLAWINAVGLHVAVSPPAPPPVHVNLVPDHPHLVPLHFQRGSPPPPPDQNPTTHVHVGSCPCACPASSSYSCCASSATPL